MFNLRRRFMIFVFSRECVCVCVCACACVCVLLLLLLRRPQADCTSAIDSIMRNVLLMSKMNADDTNALAKGLTETIDCVFSLRTLFETCRTYAAQMLHQLHSSHEKKEAVEFTSALSVSTCAESFA